MLFDLILTATALVLVVSALAAFYWTQDVLHPTMFLSPLFLYGAVIDPWLVKDQLPRYFHDPSDVTIVLTVYLVALVALVVGVMHHAAEARTRTRGVLSAAGSSQRRSLAVTRIAWGLAAWALASYSYALGNAGGFVAAYSQVKGGGYGASGYLTEGVNLSLVAAILAGLSRYRRGWTPASLTLLIAGLLPNLLQGTFGGRRGPLFLALATALVCWYLGRRRAPRVVMIWPSLAAIGLAMLFVASQRQFLFLGSGESVRWDEFARAVTQEDTDQGNNFIYGAGFILTTRHAAEYTWGREIAVNLFVRPIPKQMWPTKYEDVGATWITSGYPGLGQVTQGDWLAAVGWLPLAGSSAISISDLYGEFGWGVVMAFYLIGRAFAELNLRRCTRGGMWELLYFEALILSVYLATQSFSAFYHRYLVVAVPTVVVWQAFVRRTHVMTTVAHGARRLRFRSAPLRVTG